MSHSCTYVHTCIHMLTFIRSFIHSFIHSFVHAFMHTCILYIYIYIFICVFICLFICLFIYLIIIYLLIIHMLSMYVRCFQNLRVCLHISTLYKHGMLMSEQCSAAGFLAFPSGLHAWNFRCSGLSHRKDVQPAVEQLQTSLRSRVVRVSPCFSYSILHCQVT